MPLMKLVHGPILFAKENPNILAAIRLLRPVIKNPFAQVIFSFLVGYYATTKISQIYELIQNAGSNNRNQTKSQLPQKREALRLTSQQLCEYDGLHDNQPIYTALNGNIYDLSTSRETFSKLGPYSLLAGCNANQVLNIACGFMGISTDNVVERWEQSLNAEFHIIGILIDSDGSENEADDEAEYVDKST